MTYELERPGHLPDFANPPLDEVVLGVQFEPIVGYLSVHSRGIWDLFSESYPTVQEKPSLDPQFETFGGFNTQGNVELQIGVPPVGCRLWFISADHSHLLQFQPNRFLINWRRRPNSETYPRFESIAEEFRANLITLVEHVRETFEHEISINQVEVTYINVIPVQDFGEAGNWFSIWDSKSINAEILTANVSEVHYNEEEKPCARLFHEIQCGQTIDGKQKAFRFSLVFRGIPNGKDLSSAIEFLRLGREKIVLRFDEITTEQAHTIWSKLE